MECDNRLIKVKKANKRIRLSRKKMHDVVTDSAFDCLLPAWSSLESTLCFSLRFICTCSRAAQKLAAAFVNYFYAPFYLCCKKKKFGKVQKLRSGVSFDFALDLSTRCI